MASKIVKNHEDKKIQIIRKLSNIEKNIKTLILIICK